MTCSAAKEYHNKKANQRNKYSRDDNNINDKESQPKTNQCPECGILLKNGKGLKIHRSSKHKRQQNNPTSPGFWPCKSDSRCDTCKRGHFCTSVESSKKWYKTSDPTATSMQIKEHMLFDPLQTLQSAVQRRNKIRISLEGQ